MDLHRPYIAEAVLAPDLLVELIGRKKGVGVAHEQAEDAVFHIGQMDVLALAVHTAVVGIQPESRTDVAPETGLGGIHLHPAVVRSVFRLFGDERVCLISDSMRAAGMPNGVYSLGGQTVYMTDGKATLEDGTIAGSATCLAECFRRAVSFGVPLDAALRAATINPAQAVGLFDELGSITAGKRADILVLDETLHPEKIFIGGVQTK